MTNLLSRKLRSKAGASMILALVFLLFCTFVGGSVLTSATANAYRVEHLSDQQDFLNQRSAALLLSDLLQQEEGEYLQLKVTDAVETHQEMRQVNQGGAFEETGKSMQVRIITFEVFTNDTTINPMQKLMLETSVFRYLREYAAAQQYSVVLYNFPKYNGVTITSTDQFLFDYDVPSAESDDHRIQRDLLVTGTSDAEGVTLPEYKGRVSVGNGTDIYDFYVDFGELSLMKLTKRASAGTTSPITVTGTVVEGNGTDPVKGAFTTGFVRITTESKQTTISWRDPLIEKGGAGA